MNSSNLPSIDSSWTLFLDRDGVLNKKRDNDYVKSIDELEILDGILDSMASLSKHFGPIVIVTNQQGVGKGLMTEEDLAEVHSHLEDQITEAGGRLDGIYVAPQLASENSPMRKPNPGMAYAAIEDHPSIDLSKTILVGDSPSDMEFGHNAGVYNVMVGNKESQYAHYRCEDLNEFAKLIDAQQ